jgi:hypothetical protein
VGGGSGFSASKRRLIVLVDGVELRTRGDQRADGIRASDRHRLMQQRRPSGIFAFASAPALSRTFSASTGSRLAALRNGGGPIRSKPGPAETPRRVRRS